MITSKMKDRTGLLSPSRQSSRQLAAGAVQNIRLMIIRVPANRSSRVSPASPCIRFVQKRSTELFYFGCVNMRGNFACSTILFLLQHEHILGQDICMNNRQAFPCLQRRADEQMRARKH